MKIAGAVVVAVNLFAVFCLLLRSFAIRRRMEVKRRDLEIALKQVGLHWLGDFPVRGTRSTFEFRPNGSRRDSHVFAEQLSRVSRDGACITSR